MKTYLFYCQLGTREIKYKDSWTEEEYRSLLAKQQNDPVRLFSDSGRTIWMFQDRFYRADDALKEVEVKALEKTYHFRCKQGTGEIRSKDSWTEEEYRSLLAKQQNDLVRLFSDSDKTWWMFQDRFYRADDTLKEVKVKAVLVEQPRKSESKLRLELNQVNDLLKNMPNWGGTEDVVGKIIVLERQQQNIERALRMIELGQYGFCECCGGQISPERLEALPSATRCINCW